MIIDLNSTSNVVAGNFIGHHAGGDGVLANGGDGVLIDDGSNNNTIGGTVAAPAT